MGRRMPITQRISPRSLMLQVARLLAWGVLLVGIAYGQVEQNHPDKVADAIERVHQGNFEKPLMESYYVVRIADARSVQVAPVLRSVCAPQPRCTHQGAHRECSREAWRQGRRPQEWVKPRIVKVDGFPSPRCFRSRAAKRPTSISRVLSGCNSKPNFASRSGNALRNRWASVRC
jgi:hypothetical protein